MLRAGVCLCAILGASACHDADGDPMAVILTEETRSTLLLEAGTSSFPDLVARARMDGELARATQAWMDSWEVEGAAAAALREEAYATASPRLVGTLGEAVVREEHARLAAALRAAGALPTSDLTGAMELGIDEAERLHAKADARLAAGRLEEALTLSLRASDALLTVGPEGVARLLAARAERALTGPGLATPVRERADRLVRGARQALDDGDWSRAMRRAYYACQVLGISPH